MKVAEGLSAVALRRQLSEGKLSFDALASHYREVIARGDRTLHAWVSVGSKTGTPAGNPSDLAEFPLFGLPVGVKDVIDTRDHRTEYGSEIYRGNRPSADAACVARIRESGGLVLGKTATTEFATRRPCATRNPLNPDHTPGGSSSGSAAAVAAGMTPLAVGTQTAGSVIRPAAFCGVAAIKPTFGIVNRVGVKQLSDSVDTVGFFARYVADLALISGAVARNPQLIDFAFAPSVHDRQHVRLAFCRSPQFDSADQAMKDFFLDLSESSNREFDTRALELPRPFEGLDTAVDVIIESEIWHGLGYERTQHWEQCSSQLQQLFSAGAKHSIESVIRAQRHAELARLAFDAFLDDVDCLVTPSAPGEATRGLDDTGPAIFNKVWNLLHVPCVTIPAGRGPNGLPFGLQVVAKRNKDHVALAGAEKLASMLREFGHATIAGEPTGR